MVSICLLSCNESSTKYSIEAFNNKFIYSMSPCNNNITVYTQNIKKEYHQIDNFFTLQEQDICSGEYEVDGKPLNSFSESFLGVLTYAIDSSSYQVLDKNNNPLVKFTLIKNDDGQIIQKSSDNMVIDYSYSENNQLNSMSVYKYDELIMTYTYQFDNNEIISSCFNKNMRTIRTEYTDNNIVRYAIDDDLSCEQVKQKYITKDYDKFSPITKYVSQCEKTDNRGNCIYSKSFVDDILVSEKRSSYEYY